MRPAQILEINTRLWLRRLGGGQPQKLQAVPDKILDEWQNQGFDAVWLMGIWQASDVGAQIARSHPDLQREYRQALPDLQEADITGSPYAIQEYKVLPELGGDAGLAAFRKKLQARGMKLLLDFVPNHVALDHPWIHDHPEWFIAGREEQLHETVPGAFRAHTAQGEKLICHGRDPYFPAWTDTAQLDLTNEELQESLHGVLNHLASICDGVRCDMAMLVICDVFEKTWGMRPAQEFWPGAISEARSVNPEFCFLAEVYWELDDVMLAQGFDLTYDKISLDRAVHGPQFTREMFEQSAEEHAKRLRFLENHDEPRIASRVAPEHHFAAAAWLFALPSATLIHEGQLEGKRVRVPVQLQREPEELHDDHAAAFYADLLKQLKRPELREGNWRLLTPRSAWTHNESHRRILGQAWEKDGKHIVIFVNWADNQSQCWVDLEMGDLTGKRVVLRDTMNAPQYIRDGHELTTRGLYLDVPAWHIHIFDCEIQDIA